MLLSIILLRTLAEAMRLTASDGLGPWPFELEGQVYSAGGRICDFKDATGGYPFENDSTNGCRLTLGDIVRIRGELTVDPDDLHHFQVRDLEILRNAPLPTPIPLADADLDDPASIYNFATLRGTLTAVTSDDLDFRFLLLTLKTEHRSVEVAVRSSLIPRPRLRELLGAEVEVTGLFKRKSGFRRRVGSHLFLSKAEDLRVLVPPPADPFAVPELRDGAPRQRCRITGRVLAAGHRRFFLSTRTGRFLEVHVAEEAEVPAADACVETCGFVELDPFLPCLTEALVRPAAEALPPMPAPLEIDFNRLFTRFDNSPLIDTTKHGRLIRLRGKVSDLVDSTRPGVFFLQHDRRSITVDPTGLGIGYGLPPAGSEIEITGLCLMQFEGDAIHGSTPRFRRYVLLPRTAGDIAVLKSPSWWTPLRLLLVIIGLALALVAALLWNRSLRILSERRGRKLYREELGHAVAEQKAEERTRLAVELHDSISQTLTGVAMQIDAAGRADAEHTGNTRQFLDTARMMLASCRHELRCCIWDLRTRTFEEKNLGDAILRTVTPHAGGIDLAVRFNVARRLLSESTIHVILKIIRELAVNAVRHGHASRLKVAGERHGETISFSVRDDGAGFDPAAVGGAEAGHFGLQGIRERLNDYNGSLVVDSTPGRGTRVEITMTVPELREAT